MTLASDTCEVRGISFHNFLASLERLRGPEMPIRLSHALAPEVRAPLERGELLKMGWYPLEWYRTLHEAAFTVTGEGPELAFAIGRDATLHDFRGIYRLLRFVLTPESLIQRAPGVFGRYRRPGTLNVEQAKPRFARARIERCLGYSRSIWQEVAGGCSAVLEVCGAINVHCTIVETEPGIAIFEARWS